MGAARRELLVGGCSWRSARKETPTTAFHNYSGWWLHARLAAPPVVS